MVRKLCGPKSLLPSTNLAVRCSGAPAAEVPPWARPPADGRITLRVDPVSQEKTSFPWSVSAIDCATPLTTSISNDLSPHSRVIASLDPEAYSRSDRPG